MRKRPTYEELAATTLNKVQLGTPTLPYVPPNNAEFALMQLKGLSEDIRLRELSVQALRRDSEQVAAQTGLPPEVIQRLVGASEASVAVSREMQQQQQHAQSANQRQQQLQTEAILTQLGTAAAAQQQQNSMLQQLSSSLANAAPGAPQPATPPAIDTQQLATFMGGAISGTAREVGNQMAARFRELLQEAAMGNQAISQQMFQPIMTYIENLPQQNQILQYFDNRSQFVTANLNQVILNSQQLTQVNLNIDARQQLQRNVVQQVVNVLNAQGIPPQRENVNNVLGQLTNGQLALENVGYGALPLPPPQDPPPSMPFDPLDPLQARSFSVNPALLAQNVPPATLSDMFTETYTVGPESPTVTEINSPTGGESDVNLQTDTDPTMPPPPNPKAGERGSIKNLGRAQFNAGVVTVNTALQAQNRSEAVAKARQGDATASQALTATGNPLPPPPKPKATSSAASSAASSAGPFQTAWSGLSGVPPSKGGAKRPPQSGASASASVPRIVPQDQLQALKGKGKGKGSEGLSIQDLVQTVSSEEEDPRRGNRRRSQ